ncbi:sterol desaturase family protein, partial [Patescibacteria group bacterium AH-259-L07]|nr:sterol desaturase family protein [Patescibacteria group bacterium AH-259-L07]
QMIDTIMQVIDKLTAFDVVRALFMLTVGSVVIVESVWDFWHRFVWHKGILGDRMRKYHRKHHKIYTEESFQRSGKYERAEGIWNVALLILLPIVLVVLIFPLRDVVPLILGSLVYIIFIHYVHEAFHKLDHWLHRYAWFKRLEKLHKGHHLARCNYGLIFSWWDKRKKTLREEIPTEKEDLFPGYKIKG